MYEVLGTQTLESQVAQIVSWSKKEDKLRPCVSDITGCTHTLARCQLCPKLTSAVSQRLAHRVPRPFVHVLEHTAVQHSKGERTMGSTKNTHTSRLPTPTPTETDL